MWISLLVRWEKEIGIIDVMSNTDGRPTFLIVSSVELGMVIMLRDDDIVESITSW